MTFVVEILAKSESFPGVSGRLRKTFTCDADAALLRVRTELEKRGATVLGESVNYPVLVVSSDAALEGLGMDVRVSQLG